jgi:hypothetical protein
MEERDMNEAEYHVFEEHIAACPRRSLTTFGRSNDQWRQPSSLAAAHA